MELGTLLNGLDILLILVWSYAVYLAAHVSNFSRSLGRYTSAMPYFFGAAVLFLLVRVIDPVFELVYLDNIQAAESFLFSLETIQALAGLILFKGLHEIYKVTYAKEGFMGVDER